MSEPKKTAPNAQPKSNAGALILIILTAIAIIASLILGGIRLFGGNAENPNDTPTDSPSIDPDDPNFKLEAWPSDQEPLSGYGLLSGTLLVPTDDYVPSEESLQKIVKKGQFLADDIQIDKEANEALVRMLTQMNSDCSFAESITVHTAYKSDGDYRTGMTVRFRLVRSSGEYCYLREATGDNPVTWFEENAWKYGFILRYPEGNTVKEEGNLVSDVYRYVGIPHAYYITKVLKLEDENAVPTLENYIEHVKNVKVSDSTFKVTGSGTDDGIYNVYYVKAAEADKALLREGAEIYGVSGIGDGYIVTSLIRTNEDGTDGGTSSEEQSEDSTETPTEESAD